MSTTLRLNRIPIKLLALNLFISQIGWGTTIIRSSFEPDESPPYHVGTLHGQNGWLVSSGSASVSNESVTFHSGQQGVQITAQQQSLIINRTFFSGTETGIGGVVYGDFWVKIAAMSGKYLAFNGYDLYGSSQKRAFVIEFGTPAGESGEIRIYSGATKVPIGSYRLGDWNRITFKVDYNQNLYQVIFNNGQPVSATFREDYVPTAAGQRLAGVKELHQLRINLGYDSAVGSVVAYYDDLYIGTEPIPDIQFDPLQPKYTLTVNQPSVGSIQVQPQLNEYPESTLVTVSLTLPEGYLNLGWTGDLSGTDLIQSFYMIKNMTIGAQIGIDSTNPPPQYLVSVIQPPYGFISLTPPGDSYYKYTLVTAKINLPAGYLFNGWTGDLSGTQPEQSFRVMGPMTISAVVLPDTTPPQIYLVSNATELKNLLKGNNLRPGDIVEVLNGTYDLGSSITIESCGNADHPILIRSQQIGGAIFTGKTAFILRKAAYIHIEGFDFRSNAYTAIKLEACHHIRITRNFFRLLESEGQSAKWVYIGGVYNDPYAASSYNRIDHNLFENKHQLGNFITIDGQQEPVFQVSQYDMIDHNYFRNIGPRAVNEMEAIRLGVSDLSMSSGYCIIEYNLFEDCDGDPEIVSVKACDNIIRYNTFRRSQGTLCLRHGNRNSAEGNFFLGELKEGTGGIRLYGNDHKIFNNYFENLMGSKWDAALSLTNGDYDGENSGGLTDHWRIKRAFIGFNTIVNCFSSIEIGFTNNGNYQKPPTGVTLANNLVWAKKNQIVTVHTPPQNTSWVGNLMYPDSTAVLGITLSTSEIKVENPCLIYGDGLWVLAANSPAIDAALGEFPWIREDLQGQPRTGRNDIGADEFSSAPILRRPLTSADVGPWAREEQLRLQSPSAPVPDQFQIFTYPNPFNTMTTVTLILPHGGLASLEVYNLRGQLVQELMKTHLSMGEHQVRWNAANFPSGIYLLRLQTPTTTICRPITLVK